MERRAWRALMEAVRQEMMLTGRGVQMKLDMPLPDKTTLNMPELFYAYTARIFLDTVRMEEANDGRFLN